jgi:hypothetical protein
VYCCRNNNGLRSSEQRQDRGPRLRGGTRGNEKADVLAGKVAEKKSYSRVMSLAHLKLQISEKFRKAKTAWHDAPGHHGSEEIPPPPPKSCLWNALVRTAVQIRTGHWRSAVYLKRIRKMGGVAGGTDEDSARAAKMDEWCEKNSPSGRRIDCSSLFVSFVRGLVPRDLRTAHC